MPRNPFEVLGLTPEIVADLNERQLRVVVKAMYRVLQKTFHPDVPPAGDEAEDVTDGEKRAVRAPGEKATELNLAYESLNFERDPAGFRRLRKGYLAKRPQEAWRNSVLLKNRLEEQLEREDRLADSYFDYLTGVTAPELSAPPASDLIAPLPAKGVRLGLLDVAINNNIRQASWLMGTNYKQMEFDAQGGLRVKAVGRGRFSRSNYIHPLGCVPVQSLELEPLLERTHSQTFREMASYPGALRPKLKVLNLMSLDNFKRSVLPLLTPVLMERAYLFSINKDEFKKSGLISLEGVIVKLDLL